MGNVFALLGLRALFVLVEGMVRRFRYLDETIAIVLAVVAREAAARRRLQVRPEASLAIVLALLAGGHRASLLADRRERRSDAASRLRRG